MAAGESLVFLSGLGRTRGGGKKISQLLCGQRASYLVGWHAVCCGGTEGIARGYIRCNAKDGGERLRYKALMASLKLLREEKKTNA